jgi:hypothetical protein
MSVGIGAIIGLVRWPRIAPSYRPMIYWLWMGLCSEIVSFLCIRKIITESGSNAVASNIFILLDFLLLTWQFYNWGSFDNRKRLLKVLLVLLPAVWISDMFVTGSINDFSPAFRIGYALLCIYLGVQHINQRIVNDRKDIFKNARFYFCAGIIIIYSYTVLRECGYMMYAVASKDIIQKVDPLVRKIIDLYSYINFIVNLIYAIGVIWVPRKRTSLLSV